MAASRILARAALRCALRQSTMRFASLASRPAIALSAIRSSVAYATRNFSEGLPSRMAQEDVPAENQGQGWSAEVQEARRDGRAVLLYNIIYDISDADLATAMSVFGEVAHVKRFTQNKGTAFVCFKDKEAAEAAAKRVDGTTWHGRRIRAMVAEEKGVNRPTTPTNTLYIGNLPFDVTEDEVSNITRDLKGIFQVRCKRNAETGMTQGFLHLEFHTTEDAIEARKALEGLQIRERRARVNHANEAYRVHTAKLRQQLGSEGKYDYTSTPWNGAEGGGHSSRIGGLVVEADTASGAGLYYIGENGWGLCIQQQSVLLPPGYLTLLHLKE